MKKLSLAIAGVLLFSGCSLQTTMDSNTSTTPSTAGVKQELKTYTSTDFSLSYPNSYTLTKNTLGDITIAGPNGSIIVSKHELGAAPADAVGAPKSILSHGYSGNIQSALFYTGEGAPPAELVAIQNSIRITE